jgi:uncharacterized membrane protein YfhO
MRANGFFRGIFISPGSHHVVFSYKPMSFLIGLVLAAAMLGLIAVFSILKRIKSGAE